MSSEPAAEGQGTTLRKSVGLIGVVTFGAGTAIGVSIFSILQPTAQVASTAAMAQPTAMPERIVGWTKAP